MEPDRNHISPWRLARALGVRGRVVSAWMKSRRLPFVVVGVHKKIKRKKAIQILSPWRRSYKPKQVEQFLGLTEGQVYHAHAADADKPSLLAVEVLGFTRILRSSPAFSEMKAFLLEQEIQDRKRNRVLRQLEFETQLRFVRQRARPGSWKKKKKVYHKGHRLRIKQLFLEASQQGLSIEQQKQEVQARLKAERRLAGQKRRQITASRKARLKDEIGKVTGRHVRWKKAAASTLKLKQVKPKPVKASVARPAKPVQAPILSPASLVDYKGGNAAERAIIGTKRLVTCEEAARVSGKSVDYWRDLCSKWLIPSERIGEDFFPFRHPVEVRLARKA